MRTLFFLAMGLLSLPVTAGNVPWFDEIDCPFGRAEQLEAAGVRCGTLRVPERRDRESTAELRLTVLVIEAVAEDPAADPVVFLAGGPGYSALAGGMAWMDHPMREERTVVLMDQRGTGYSEPRLCANLAAETLEILALDATPQEEAAARRQAAERCLETVRRQGYDLSILNSRESAADLDDLRRLLGYESWNVYGASYGTRLALTLARDFPDSVRSLVLDSPLPPNADLYADHLSNFEQAVSRVAARCREDSVCATAFPDLGADLRTAIANLEDEPLRVVVEDEAFPAGEFVFNPQDLVIAIQQSLYGGETATFLPLLIDQARQLRGAPLGIFADQFATRADGLSFEMYYAVNCQEEAPFTDRVRLEDEVTRGARKIGLPSDSLSFFSSDLAVCDGLGLPAAPAIEQEAVVSSVPTLILSGEFDPITPLAYADLTASTLTASHRVALPGRGHAEAARHPCPKELIAAFLMNPSRAPETGCIDEISRDPFVVEAYMAPSLSGFGNGLLQPRFGHLLWLGLTALALAFSGLIWPLIPRRDGSSLRFGPSEWVGWTLVLAALLGLVFLVGVGAAFNQTMAERPVLLAFGLPAWTSKLFVLPWVIGALVGTACLGGIVRRVRGLPVGLARGIAFIGCLSFLAWLGYWGFLGLMERPS